MHGVGDFCWIYVWNNCGDINFSCEKFRLTGNYIFFVPIENIKMM